MKIIVVRRLSFGLVCIIALCGNSCTATGETAFAALRKCAATAVQPSDAILYFGPNSVPIGTIYEKVGGGYDLSYRGTQITGDPPPIDVVQPPQYASCSFQGNSKFDLKLAFGVATNALPVAGEVSNDFKQAKVLKMTADQVGWEMIYKGPYRQLLKNNQPVMDGIKGMDTFATVSLLKVKGYSVTLQVTAGDVAALKAKYPYPAGQVKSDLTGEITAGVNATWDSDTTITLKIDGESAIGGVMRAINKGDLASAGGGESELFGAGVGADREIVNTKTAR